MIVDNFLPSYLQRPISLDKLQGDLAEDSELEDLFGDHGFQMENIYSQIQQESILSCLTKRQQTVVALLLQGYKRKEIAHELDVVLQAIHQIIPRIRKRLIARYDRRIVLRTQSI